MKIVLGVLIIILILMILFGTTTVLPNKKESLEIIRSKYKQFVLLVLRQDMKYEEEYIEQYDNYATKYYVIHDEGNLYKVTNFSKLTKNLFTNFGLKQFINKDKIVFEKGDYYISAIGNISKLNYHDSDVEIVKTTPHSIKARINSYFCEKKECSDSQYKILKSEFIFMREGKEWKIDKFQFLENEEVIFSE